MKTFAQITDALLLKLATHGYYPTPIIDLGVLVARADGTIDENERLLLKELFRSALDERLPNNVVEHLVNASQEVTRHAGSGPRLRLLADILVDCECEEEGLLVGYAIARVDGGMHEKEAETLADLARFAGVTDARRDAIQLESEQVALPELRASTSRLPSAFPE
jgi:tellurite resistance protein